MGFLSVGLMLYFQVFQFTKMVLWNFNAALAGRLIFSLFKEKKAALPSCCQSLKRWEIAIFEVAYMLYFSDFGDYFFRHGIFVGERKRGIQFRDCTLRRTEGGRRVFAWAMKYFRHKLMIHEMFLKIFDEPQFFLCFQVLIVLNDFI